MNARKRLGAAFAAAALLTLTACSGGDDPAPSTAPIPTASTSPSTGPGATPTPGTPEVSRDPETGQVDYCKDQETKPFTGPAAQKWGAENVMRAYCDMVALQMEQSFLSNLMRQDDGFTTQDFSVPAEWMTEVGRKDWDKRIANVVNNPSEDPDTEVWSLMFYDLEFEGGEYEFFPEGEQPSLVSLSATPADTWIDDSTGFDRLGMEFSINAEFLVTPDGKKRFTWPIEKEFIVALVKNGTNPDKPWLMDGWNSTIKSGYPAEYDPQGAPATQGPTS